MLFKATAIVLGWSVAAVLLVLIFSRLRMSGTVRDRLYEEELPISPRPQSRGLAEMNWFRRWLYVAGFRNPGAPVLFVLASVAAGMSGVVAALLIHLSGVSATVSSGVEAIPGGVGQLFLPLTLLLPWFLGTMLCLAPWLYVRSARRQRVLLVEQDLPLALELLATLSEAGLGFDAALARILETRLANRPLADEFRTFQADLLAGRPRIESLRRFSQRLQISTVSIFISAVAQAEQIGMGISGVLRRQADDMRSRRREKANAFAAALPVKRMLPLVICFLPGLFVWTLGPFFVQLFKIADTFVQVRSF